MGATLEALRELQEIELQIMDIRRQLASKERQLRNQETRSKGADDALAAEHHELKRLQMQFDEANLDVKARDAHLAKLRETLNSVRTNKEYATVLQQLNTEKAEKTRVETRAFEILAQIDAKKQVEADKQKTKDDEQGRRNSILQELERSRKLFADRLAELDRQRGAAAANLPEKVQDLFNRVSERYDGEVMARVIRVHPRRDDFICEGCNMSLAAERANLLMTRDEVITCDNCGRILFIERNT